MGKELNLICICFDTLRADIIGEGKKLSFVETHNMDNFADESIIFDRAFCEGAPTIQVRRAWFTGKRSFPWRFNVDRRGVTPTWWGWHKIPDEHTTLAEILLRRGYYTGLITDVPHYFQPTINFHRGFVNYDFIRGNGAEDPWRAGSIKMVETLAKQYKRPKLSRFLQYLLNIRDRKSEEDYTCAQLFIRASKWLEDSLENQPFFLWIDSFDPHEPWDPPSKYAELYSNFDGEEKLKAQYFGEVTFADVWFGRLLEKIDDLGLLDNTIIMLLSDHGTQLLDHGHYGKQYPVTHPSQYAHDTQINWIVRHPDGPRGRHITQFVQTHDLTPTILAMLDIPFERQDSIMDGENVWSLVTGEKEIIRDHVVIGWCNTASVRDDEWNYVTDFTLKNDPESALYHLSQDPEENCNVMGEEPNIVKKQRKRLETILGQPLPAQPTEKLPFSELPRILEYLKNRYNYKLTEGEINLFLRSCNKDKRAFT